MSLSRKEKVWLIIVGIILALLIVYMLGPKPKQPDFSALQLRSVTTDLRALEDSIAKREATFPLKPDNEARIVWDTQYVKTKFSIVYLPGNGATQEEGDPMHEAIAHRYGYNMYL